MRIQGRRRWPQATPQQAKSPRKVDPGERNTSGAHPPASHPDAHSQAGQSPGAPDRFSSPGVAVASNAPQRASNCEEPDSVSAASCFTFEPISDGADLATANAPSAYRRCGITNRRCWIGMLRSPEARRSPDRAASLLSAHTVRARHDRPASRRSGGARSKDARANRCNRPRFGPKLSRLGDGHCRPHKDASREALRAPPQSRHPASFGGWARLYKAYVSPISAVSCDQGVASGCRNCSGRSPAWTATPTAPNRNGAEANRRGCETFRARS